MKHFSKDDVKKVRNEKRNAEGQIIMSFLTL